MDLKKCIKCKLELPLEKFCKNRAIKKDGLQAMCRDCYAVYMKVNKDRIRITRLRWEQAHTEQEKIRLKLRYANNKEKRNEQSRMYRAKKKLLRKECGKEMLQV